jgi:hypothetical protein
MSSSLLPLMGSPSPHGPRIIEDGAFEDGAFQVPEGEVFVVDPGRPIVDGEQLEVFPELEWVGDDEHEHDELGSTTDSLELPGTRAVRMTLKQKVARERVGGTSSAFAILSS